MKLIKLLVLVLLVIISPQLWAQQSSAGVSPASASSPAFALSPAAPEPAPGSVSPVGVKLYCTEALRLMVTPLMHEKARAITKDPVLCDKIQMDMALDCLYCDGFRLVRSRGVIVGDNGLDDLTIYRTVRSFSVTPEEARAWIVASRLMQMGEFKNDGVALQAVEQDVLRCAGEQLRTLRKDVGCDRACKIMPRLSSELESARDREYSMEKPSHELWFGPCHKARNTSHDDEFGDNDESYSSTPHHACGHGPEIYHFDY